MYYQLLHLCIFGNFFPTCPSSDHFLHSSQGDLKKHRPDHVGAHFPHQLPLIVLSIKILFFFFFFYHIEIAQEAHGSISISSESHHAVLPTALYGPLFPFLKHPKHFPASEL